MSIQFRIGQGFDVHSFAPDRKLILGGVHIPHHLGLLGHSDADVLVHAICDSILGSLALGDIGKWFPDSSQKFKDADSLNLLSEIVNSDQFSGWSVANIDSTIIAQSPKLAPFTDQMRSNIAKTLGIDLTQVSVKATTTEKLGFTGRNEGIAAMASALCQKTV